MQSRLRKAALDAGVTMIAPETVFLAADTKFGKDVHDRTIRGDRGRG